MNSHLLKKSLFLFLACLGFGITVSAQQPVNHVQNAGLNVDKSNWEFIFDGDGTESVIDATGGYEGTGALLTGYDTRMAQTLNYTDMGFSDSYLDSAPIIRFAVNAKGTGPDVGDQIRYYIELRDGSDQVLESFSSDWTITTADWQLVTHNFTRYGEGLRSVYFWIEGWDVEANTLANEGVLIDDVNLSIGNHLIYTNTAATNTLAGWENIVQGGDGWNTAGWAQGSSQWCTKGQTVDLMDMGYSAAALDSEPSITVGEWILGVDGPMDGSGFADEHILKVELRDENGAVLDSYDSGVIFCSDSWQYISTEFTDYGMGLRSVYVEHSSQDAEIWAGHFAGYVDATNMVMNFCLGFTVTESVMNETVDGADDGSISLAVSGGVEGYSYAWSNGGSSATINGLADGDYTVTITDDYGCEDIRTYNVAMGAPSSVDQIDGLSAFDIAPNPTNDRTQVTINLDKPMEAQLQIFDLAGKMIYAKQAEQFINRTYDIDLSIMPSGIYSVKLILDNQVVTKKIVKQ